MKKRGKKRAGEIIAAGCLLLVLTGCGNSFMDKSEEKSGNVLPTEDVFSKTDFVMDTVLQMTVYGKTDCTEEIKNVLEAAETEKLSWREKNSEVSQINEACGKGEGFPLDADFSGWVGESLDLARKSGGAFDPTIGNLTRLWNIEGDHPVVPAKADIEAVRKDIGYSCVHMGEKDSGEGLDVISMEKGVTLDLGAVGKGIGCDLAKDTMEKTGAVEGAVVAIGGSILTYGKKPDKEGWKVAVQDPAGTEGEYMGVLHIDGTAFVSTSGDYEKYFIEDGKKYHHILNPSTGYPAESGMSSVTIVCRPGETRGEYPGLLSDGLSTACFILGEEKGKELLEEYGAEGVFIDKDNKVTVTDGMRDSLELLNENYKMK